MPILPPEPDIFPENLLDFPESLPGVDSASTGAVDRWWALYTMARREKELMRRLRTMQIRHYGPLIPQRKKVPNGRVRVSYLPLFPGYVFLCGNEADRYRALTTNCVSRCLPVDVCDQLVYDLQQVRRLIQSGTSLSPEAKIQPGMRVRIRNGSLAGMEGTVLKRRGGDRLLVAVRFLQKGASMQLDDFEVEQIDA
jgi:transcriptional antiterminator RfaH